MTGYDGVMTFPTYFAGTHDQVVWIQGEGLLFLYHDNLEILDR